MIVVVCVRRGHCRDPILICSKAKSDGEAVNVKTARDSGGRWYRDVVGLGRT